MRNVVNFLRGSVRLEAAGPFPERFLNICAANGVGFWGVERLDEHTLRLTVARRDGARAAALGAGALCAVRVCARRGAPDFAARFRRRYGMLAGLGLSLLAVAVLSRFVLVVEIHGCDRVPEQTVRAELARLGLRPGAFGPGVDARALGNQLLLAVEELSWFTVSIHGIRAEVEVRERLPAPALEEENADCDVVAARDGLVTEVLALAGRAQAQEGDSVVAGDVLITGYLAYEDEAKSGAIVAVRRVRAEGQVWARTWRSLSAALPLEADTKAYTGRTQVRYALSLLEKRINFYGNGGISYANYDKITERRPLTLPGGLTLPVALLRERRAEYVPAAAEVNVAAAEALLRERLEARLSALLGEGTAQALSWDTRVEGGVLTVTLHAECREQIGIPRARQSGDGNKVTEERRSAS